MRHFGYLAEADSARLFHRPPESFGPGGDLDALAVALGATLYCPATRPRLARDVIRLAGRGVTSFVMCLEDAIADADVGPAEANLIAQLQRLAQVGAVPALLFVRVRAVHQIDMIVNALGDQVGILAGFVVPKFGERDGAHYLSAIVDAGQRSGHPLLIMPVLETQELIYAESRVDSLVALAALLDKYRDHVLALRVGAADLGGVYALRRPRELTVYDVRVLADAIAAFVNVLGRDDGTGFVITGPVWEHFAGPERIFKPQLRQTPFHELHDRQLRAELLARDLDGLIREITLDQANGLTGKSVIHPSHVALVHALSVVPHEQFADAEAILGTAERGGAAASLYRNKMNESKPHAGWARRTVARARAFGVSHDGVSPVDLLAASLHR